jgi:DNA-directed RNA polymerase specialized sigma54-like protein
MGFSLPYPGFDPRSGHSKMPIDANYSTALQGLIDSEDKRFPYSDEHLSVLLQDKGLLSNRRKVSDCRKKLKIGSSYQRCIRGVKR